MQIVIETSARHAHITKEHVAILFGEGYQLRNKRELSQPGQFLTEEKLRVEGPRGALDNVSILGPERKASQVEVSLTDARVLGVAAPVRESGNVVGSAPVKLVGPAGSVELSEGCIAAKRHIHLSPAEAEKAGVSNGEIVSVKTSGERALVFGEVVVRVNPEFKAAMHIDVDETNAAGLGIGTYGEIIKG